MSHTTEAQFYNPSVKIGSISFLSQGRRKLFYGGWAE